MEILKPTKMQHVAAAIELIIEYVETTDNLPIKCSAESYCETLLKRWQDVGYMFRLAMDSKTPVGFVSFSYDGVKRELWLEDLYVRPYWRKQGVAKKLLFSVEELLASTDAERLCFRTLSVPQLVWMRLSKGIKIKTEKFGVLTRADYDSWKEGK